jgi:hypothetical protein
MSGQERDGTELLDEDRLRQISRNTRQHVPVDASDDDIK